MEDGKAARMLDELALWVQQQAAEYPIRSSEFDAAILRAEAHSQAEALSVYRSSRSGASGLHAAKKSFTADIVTWHLAPTSLEGERQLDVPEGATSTEPDVLSVG